MSVSCNPLNDQYSSYLKTWLPFESSPTEDRTGKVVWTAYGNPTIVQTDTLTGYACYFENTVSGSAYTPTDYLRSAPFDITFNNFVCVDFWFKTNLRSGAKRDVYTVRCEGDDLTTYYRPDGDYAFNSYIGDRGYGTGVNWHQGLSRPTGIANNGLLHNGRFIDADFNTRFHHFAIIYDARKNVSPVTIYFNGGKAADYYQDARQLAKNDFTAIIGAFFDRNNELPGNSSHAGFSGYMSNFRIYEGVVPFEMSEDGKTITLPTADYYVTAYNETCGGDTVRRLIRGENLRYDTERFLPPDIESAVVVNQTRRADGTISRKTLPRINTRVRDTDIERALGALNSLSDNKPKRLVRVDRIF